MEDRTLKTPYDDREELSEFARKLLSDAWRRGYRARMDRKPFRCPLSSYARGAVLAWEEGWRAAHVKVDEERIRSIEERVPDVRSQEPPVRRRRG